MHMVAGEPWLRVRDEGLGGARGSSLDRRGVLTTRGGVLKILGMADLSLPFHFRIATNFMTR